jgi:hypothetical protein
VHLIEIFVRGFADKPAWFAQALMRVRTACDDERMPSCDELFFAAIALVASILS